MIQSGDKPSCQDYDPELWFPNAYDFRKPGVKRDEAIKGALTALSICNDCPLFANGQCLELAFNDVSTVDFGIYGGTLAIERQDAADSILKATEGEIWQIDIRREADRAGIIRPYIGRRQRPKPNFFTLIGSVTA